MTRRDDLERRALVAGAVLLAFATTACSDGGSCVEVTTECNPLYEPTFDNVFSTTLEMKCGIDGPCHNAGSAAGGVIYETADDAHNALLDGRVVPGDPGCSLLVRRLEATDSSLMPPGNNPLSEQERCSVRQWIERGAAR